MTSVQSIVGLLQAGVVPNIVDLTDGEQVAVPSNGQAGSATFFRLNCGNQFNPRVILPPTGLDFPGATVLLLLINNSGDPLSDTTSFDPTINADAASLNIADGAQAFFQLVFDGNAWTAFAIVGSTTLIVQRVPFVYDIAGADQHVTSNNCIGLVDLEAWGGGSGCACDGQSNSGAGGEYAARFGIAAPPGKVFDVVVGAGGTGNANSDISNPGGASSVSDDVPTVLCQANGGGATTGTTNPADGGTGGIGDITIPGGCGESTLAASRGGASPNGGGGGFIATGAAQGAVAQQPGGGAGGTSGANTGIAPLTTGADGRVIVWEYQAVAV